MSVKVNGQDHTLPSQSGYYRIDRTWQSGDVVELRLPMNIRKESMPDDPKMIALFYGPVLLAGAFEKEDAAALVEAREAPALVTGDMPLERWLKPAGAPLSWVTTIARPAEVTLKPFFMQKTGHYSVYWQELSEKEWQQRIAREEKRKQQTRHLESITIDRVIIGDEQSEKEHALNGETYMGTGNKGIYSDRAWRVATDTGGFSYRMKVPDGGPAALYCQFMGPAHYETWNCRIKIDTLTIAWLKREKDLSSPATFELNSTIPAAITHNKDSVMVRFEVNSGWQMPRLMEMRILKGHSNQ
jgi:hypothetical protein